MWLSVNRDLYRDACRDLKDIGAGHIPTILLTECSYDDGLDDFEVGRPASWYPTRGDSPLIHLPIATAGDRLLPLPHLGEREHN
jgi:hypothetical protein